MMERKKLSYEALVELCKEHEKEIERQDEMLEQALKVMRELVVTGGRMIQTAGYERFADAFVKVRHP